MNAFKHQKDLVLNGIKGILITITVTTTNQNDVKVNVPMLSKEQKIKILMKLSGQIEQSLNILT